MIIIRKSCLAWMLLGLCVVQARAQITAADLDVAIDSTEALKDAAYWLVDVHKDICATHPKNSQLFQSHFNIVQQFWPDAEYYAALEAAFRTARAETPPGGDYTSVVAEAAALAEAIAGYYGTSQAWLLVNGSDLEYDIATYQYGDKYMRVHDALEEF